MRRQAKDPEPGCGEDQVARKRGGAGGRPTWHSRVWTAVSSLPSGRAEESMSPHSWALAGGSRPHRLPFLLVSEGLCLPTGAGCEPERPRGLAPPQVAISSQLVAACVVHTVDTWTTVSSVTVLKTQKHTLRARDACTRKQNGASSAPAVHTPGPGRPLNTESGCHTWPRGRDGVSQGSFSPEKWGKN